MVSARVELTSSDLKEIVSAEQSPITLIVIFLEKVWSLYIFLAYT